MILQHVYLSDISPSDLREDAIAPRNPYRTGYGRKIPTGRMIRWNGKWRRIYVCCFSNSGTAYIADKDGNWIAFSGN